MNKQLEMLHFQLTSRCNLNCPFCGQWGDHGFMRKITPPADLDISYWKGAADSAVAYSKANGFPLPRIILWGGEPLMYDGFDAVLDYLGEKGFETAIVTNGTLLSEHIGPIGKYLKTLYISIDGNDAHHDRIRGHEGLFEEIRKNLALIPDNIQKIAMCTISEQNYEILPDMPFAFTDFNIDKILYQNLIFTTSKDRDAYCAWMNSNFSQEAKHIDSWVTDSWGDYIYKLPDVIASIKRNIDEDKYPVKVEILPRELTPENLTQWYLAEDGLPLGPDREPDYCISAFRHLHIASNGNVFPCVDFDDFSAGNIKDSDLIEIWENKIMDKFRDEVSKGNNPLCKRCPWRFNRQYKFV